MKKLLSLGLTMTGLLTLALVGQSAAQAQVVGGQMVGRHPIASWRGIEVRALGPRLRYQRMQLVGLELLHWTVVSTVARASTRKDVVMAATANGATRYVWTSTLAPIRYPSRLGFTFFDSGSNNTINCQYFDVTGEDTAGVIWNERVYGPATGFVDSPSVGEGRTQTTSIAFARVTRISTPTGGCAAGGASDQVIVFLTPWIGLQYTVNASSPLISTDDQQTSVLNVCRVDDDDASHDEVCIDGTLFRVIGGNYNVINLFTNPIGACATFGGSNCTGIYGIGDSFSITYRGAEDH